MLNTFNKVNLIKTKNRFKFHTVKSYLDKSKNDNFNPDNRTIFQVYPPLAEVTVYDVDSCINSIKNKFLTETDKRDIFYSNGIDYDRVYQYYKHVESLNNLYYNTNINNNIDLTEHYRNILNNIYYSSSNKNDTNNFYEINKNHTNKLFVVISLITHILFSSK